MYYIIANEKRLTGKNARKLDIVKGVFEHAGKEYEVILTREPGDAKIHAERITSSDEASVIVAMGGDGTLHDVLNGIQNFENCALGLIPLGTGNDFAASANVPDDVKKAAELIVFREPRPIDYIQLSSGLRSLNAVGMGIDVDVLKRAYAGKNNKKSKYLKALVSSLTHFESYDFSVSYDGVEKESHHGLIAALGNGKQIGGGIKVFPNAKIDDGYMDLYIVDYLSKPKLVGAFFKLLTGKANKIKNATAIRVKHATFTNVGDYTIEAEGELYEHMTIDAHVVEGQLKFFLPD